MKCFIIIMIAQLIARKLQFHVVVIINLSAETTANASRSTMYATEFHR